MSGITTVGTLTAVALNAGSSKDSIIQSLEPIKKALLNDVLLSGISKVGDTLYQWGTAIVATKDDFKVWLHNYLGADGLKSGVVALYEKLYGWIEIVYTWFKDKFIDFVKNISKIVENWKQIRLSLFKWGTFIGGGGGGALWGMFSSFDNWGRLSELMGNEDFTGAVEKFAELVDKNSDAFKDMGEEAMKEILEKIMEDPKEAKEIAKELLEEQDKKNEGKREEDKKEELKKEQIHESFAQPKGSPKNEGEVLGYLMGNAIQGLTNLSSFEGAIEFKAKEAMNKYMAHIEEEAKKDTKVGRANKAFLDAINGKKEELIRELGKVAEKAFRKTEKTGKIEFEVLSKAFEEAMQSTFTVPIKDGEDSSNAVSLEGVVQKPKVSKS
ncbi:hypothetical protein A6V39_00640 [Candidatus Mycoplasma haematobovis]|uniref:Uncharacterized protein n=1 Tax=Candidatus Mycoplasma haematobovis TaxID=432608 RepID=A0A1A9QE96_9MOLU|nr:hypothetical protein A6V39_00640 [Candidatus Mycoplasma haematobovis]